MYKQPISTLTAISARILYPDFKTLYILFLTGLFVRSTHEKNKENRLDHVLTLMVIYCFLFIIGDKCLHYNHCKITNRRWDFYNYLTASGKNCEIKFIKIFEVDSEIYKKYIDFN